MKLFFPVLVTVVGMAGAPSLTAVVIEVRPAFDAGLQSSFPDRNYGVAANFIVGTVASGAPNRGLLSFDIAGNVPAGATINSVTLALTDASGAGALVPSNFELHRMLNGWNEGAGAGIQTAAAGEVTWNSQAHAQNLWGVPGGEAGVDFSAPASGSYDTGTGGLVFTSTPGLVSDIQLWLDSPSANHGWIMLSDAEDIPRTARRFASSEDAARSPVLTIDFTPVPEPAHAAGLAAGVLGLWAALRRRQARG